MKISPDKIGPIAREWISKDILSKMDNQLSRFGSELLLAVNPGMVDNFVNPKAKLFAGEDGLIDLDTIASQARNLLNNSYNGSLHIPMINYDADSNDIDDIIEIAKKYAR